MGKARHNGNGIVVNLETLCLDCGRIGFIISPINKKGYYETYDEECIICKRITKHIKCKSIEELKSILDFSDDNYNINEVVLEAINTNKMKYKRKLQ